jgi:hypothetical protein
LGFRGEEEVVEIGTRLRKPKSNNNLSLLTNSIDNFSEDFVYDDYILRGS